MTQHPNPQRTRQRGVTACVVAQAVCSLAYLEVTLAQEQDRVTIDARRCLELDHIAPYAVGGQCTVENLRLRCRAHNQRYARQYFGKFRVEATLQQARLRRAAAGRPEKS